MSKILIADDEVSFRQFICEVIERMGYQVIEASDGKEAWEKFQQEQIDLSLIDVNMPRMDGIAYLEHVKAVDSCAVIIMMTAYPSAETIIKTIEDEGYTYITKPFKVEQIEDLIKRGLAFRKRQLKMRKVSRKEMPHAKTQRTQRKDRDR